MSASPADFTLLHNMTQYDTINVPFSYMQVTGVLIYIQLSVHV